MCGARTLACRVAARGDAELFSTVFAGARTRHVENLRRMLRLAAVPPGVYFKTGRSDSNPQAGAPEQDTTGSPQGPPLTQETETNE